MGHGVWVCTPSPLPPVAPLQAATYVQHGNPCISPGCAATVAAANSGAAMLELAAVHSHHPVSAATLQPATATFCTAERAAHPLMGSGSSVGSGSVSGSCAAAALVAEMGSTRCHLAAAGTRFATRDRNSGRGAPTVGTQAGARNLERPRALDAVADPDTGSVLKVEAMGAAMSRNIQLGALWDCWQPSADP